MPSQPFMAAGHAPAGGAPPPVPLRILYVEDNPDVRETTGWLLEAPGREIVAQESAEDALGWLSQERCDVLITDVNLPGLSGTELAQRVLSHDRSHWVVLCSGRNLQKDVLDWGPHVRVLPKVFGPEDLDRLFADIEADLGSRGPLG